MRDKIVRELSVEPIVGIYVVINKVNSKLYIGQSIDIERRWNQHKYGKGSLILRNAISKYGLKNFEFKILDEVNTKGKSVEEVRELLITLEQKWLDDKKPYLRENGYNIQSEAKPNIPIERPDNYGELISKIKIENNHCGKGVKQYTKSGELVKEWVSAAEIERVLGYHAENISACCLGKQKTCKRFIWQFSDTKLTIDKIKKLNKKEYHFKKVKMLTIDGELINEFDSVSEAAKYIDCPSYQISKVCTGKQKSCRGYKWSY